MLDYGQYLSPNLLKAIASNKIIMGISSCRCLGNNWQIQLLNHIEFDGDYFAKFTTILQNCSLSTSVASDTIYFELII